MISSQKINKNKRNIRGNSWIYFQFRVLPHYPNLPQKSFLFWKRKLLPLTDPPLQKSATAPNLTKLSHLQILWNISGRKRGTRRPLLIKDPYTISYLGNSYTYKQWYTYISIPQIQKTFKVHLTAYCQVARWAPHTFREPFKMTNAIIWDSNVQSYFINFLQSSQKSDYISRVSWWFYYFVPSAKGKVTFALHR